MENLQSAIDRYASQLIREGMWLSMHFRMEEFCTFAIEDISFLQKYNTHTLAYCACVKGRQWKKCATENQHAIGQGASPCVAVCPAGVAEYHHSFSRFGSLLGVVTVSLGRGGAFPTREPDRSLYMGLRTAPNFVGRFRDAPSVPAQIDAVDAKITPLCWMLQQYFEHLTVDDASDTASRTFRRIRFYLQENHTDVSLKTLSDHFHFSASHISHLFQRQAGCSIRQYCNRLRLADAQTLLRNSTLSVTEIAQMLGFSDASYFIRFFRAQTGATPRKWRKSGRE